MSSIIRAHRRIQSQIIRFFGHVASILRAASIDPTTVTRHAWSTPTTILADRQK